MLRLSLVFIAIFATSAVAQAQPDKRARALALASDSERAYKAGQFEQAAKLLVQAHEVYPEPTLLYNLGRALESMGDTKGAIDAYQQYLTDAKRIDDRPAIERRIATLKAREAADHVELEPQPALPSLAVPLPPTLTPPQPPPDERSPVVTFGPWITLGVGGATLAAGALYGWRASANHDDAVKEPVQLVASQLQATAHTDGTIANVLFVVGGAAAIGGAVWAYYEWREGARIKLAPNGVAVEWTLP